jgi:SAM-dependent methyltransferase
MRFCVEAPRCSNAGKGEYRVNKVKSQFLGPPQPTKSASDPIPHDIVWTTDRIQRFWDFISSSSGLEDSYFSKARGRSIIDFVSRRIDIGTALDMGCGRGDLIGYLLDDYEACGVDQSPQSIASVKLRFRSHPRFRGVFADSKDLPDASVDTIFIIEVVEHLDDEVLASVMSEARRLLKPTGYLVLTTPNDENLDAQKIMCPECACIFHQWQHVRSWTTSGLAQHVRGFGFQGKAVATLLSHHEGLKRTAHKIVHRLSRHSMPHMVYIGSLVERAMVNE